MFIVYAFFSLSFSLVQTAISKRDINVTKKAGISLLDKHDHMVGPNCHILLQSYNNIQLNVIKA